MIWYDVPVGKQSGLNYTLKWEICASGPSYNYTTEILVTRALYQEHIDKFLTTLRLCLKLPLAGMLGLDAEAVVILLLPKYQRRGL